MSVSKTLVRNALLGAVVAGGVLTLSASAASADVVCNRYGDCWRVHERYTTYPRALGVRFHDDAWWDAHKRYHRYHWREDRDNDRGYWRHNRWYDFH
jgi:hypothetical protein